MADTPEIQAILAALGMCKDFFLFVFSGLL